jgi:hypothetical protein
MRSALELIEMVIEIGGDALDVLIEPAQPERGFAALDLAFESVERADQALLACIDLGAMTTEAVGLVERFGLLAGLRVRWWPRG